MSQTIVFNAVNLQPGSHVLLNTNDDYSQEEALNLKTQLEARFPGVRFTFISGVEVVGVYDTEPTLTEIES
jgi:hypothetical protein